MIRVLLHGAGRMTRRVLANLAGNEKYQLSGLVTRNRPANLPGIEIHTALDEFERDVDLLIDFTLPGGTHNAARWCEKNDVALLTGTTGLSADDIAALNHAAVKVPVLWAPNLSKGMALMTSLVRQAARIMAGEATISISETHHRHKLDAPSGTALALAQAMNSGQSKVHGGNEHGQVDISSTREGEVIGEHTVNFSTPLECIEVKHKALDRDVFATGALLAGEWLVRQSAGYYTNSDWLDMTD